MPGEEPTLAELIIEVRSLCEMVERSQQPPTASSSPPPAPETSGPHPAFIERLRRDLEAERQQKAAEIEARRHRLQQARERGQL
jgi:hypothetical protein